MLFSSFAARVSRALVFCLLAQVSHAESDETRLKLDVTPLFDLGHAFALTPASLEKEFTSSGYRENPFVRWNPSHSKARFSDRPYSNISVDLTALEGSVSLNQAEVVFAEGRAVMVRMAAAHVGQAGFERVRAELAKRLECQPVPGVRPVVGWRSEESTKATLWSSEKGMAWMNVGAGTFSLALAPAHTPPGLLSAEPLEPAEAGRGMSPDFFVRLDSLLAAPGVWNLTPEAFESTVQMPGLRLKETPFYKWTSSAHDGVLLTRHVFSNTSTDLLLFDDTVNAEEAAIEFRKGRAAKVTLTLLTRGNSADADKRFDSVFKATGRALGEMLGVRPTRTIPAGRNMTKEEGFLWSTPHTLALMEYNADAPKGQVEFLRVKIMPASGRAELLNLAGIGDNATTKSRSSLSSNVKRDLTSGDVFITGVPMIDQGQKGYCVSASCARVFNYMGVKCDQDEIAQLVNNDAVRGTSPDEMYGALRKIDTRYNMRVKVVKLPRGYGLRGMRDMDVERAWKGDLVKLTQDNVGTGVPLLWAVTLPSKPMSSKGGKGPVVEDRQSGGGHMRLIIGYNPKASEILFTDSWGAGHELKRMTVAEAERMTQAVFSMQPTL